MKKKCSRCGEDRKHKAKGLCPRCYQSALRDTPAGRAAHIESYQKYFSRVDIVDARLKKIGWNVALKERAWLEQGGRCAICDRAMFPEGKGARSVVCDHSHATGLARQLLCGRCNLIAGQVESQPALFAAICAYLNKHAGLQ